MSPRTLYSGYLHLVSYYTVWRCTWATRLTPYSSRLASHTSVLYYTGELNPVQSLGLYDPVDLVPFSPRILGPIIQEDASRILTTTPPPNLCHVSTLHFFFYLSRPSRRQGLRPFCEPHLVPTYSPGQPSSSRIDIFHQWLSEDVVLAEGMITSLLPCWGLNSFDARAEEEISLNPMKFIEVHKSLRIWVDSN